MDKKLTAEHLRQFFAFESLNEALLRQLAEDLQIETLKRGEKLFEVGDAAEDSWFVIKGDIKGSYPDGRVKNVSGGTTQSRYAIGDLSPRRFAADVASVRADVLRIPRSYLEKILAFDQVVRSGQIDLFDGSRDSARWVLRMLKSKAFRSLPAGNFDRLLRRLEQVDVMAGEVIIREGDVGDYFYVIRHGTAAVSQLQGNGQSIVAYLVRGDTFGEDALISNDVRNATVTMKTNGSLLRLAKADFAELLKAPLVRWTSPGKASIAVMKGAKVIDVRLKEEFEDQCIRGAINIPLWQLRDRTDELDHDTDYILYCNTGERSASAAFILSKAGFDRISALSGGLSAMLRSLAKAGG